MTDAHTGNDTPMPVDDLALGEAMQDAPLAPTIPGCEVIEYEENEGQKEWADSVFLQEFIDSVL